MPPRSNQITTKAFQTNKKKAISWESSMVAVHEIELHQNPNQVWYQQDELKVIRKEIREICSCFYIDNDYGLEAYMDPSTQRSRTLRRRELMQIVLEEQQDQREEGAHSPEFIADLYEEISFLFMKEAQARGLQDQEAAMDAYRVEEQEKETKKTPPSTRISFSRTYGKIRRSLLRPKQ